VFKGDVADVAEVEPGAIVTVVDSIGRFVGVGHYNPQPALCCRILTREDETIDHGFFRRRIERARELRGEVPATAARRLVWSEGDRLPGLIVDVYAGILVGQCSTLGMARARADIRKALDEALSERPLFWMDDASAARREGFPPQRGWADAPGPASVIIEEGAVRLRVTFGIGHKTGLYLDQRENRLRAAALGRDRVILDAFSATGAFACHALVGGARNALCLESSPEAVTGARDNLALNGVAERAEVRPVNAFDELRRLERERARFGLIILDPPPFARGRDSLQAAARGYKEINLRALRLLEPGGQLLTFSCSHHVGDDAFETICREAASDAGKSVMVEAMLTQAGDHPVLLEVPESRYLKGRLLRVVADTARHTPPRAATARRWPRARDDEAARGRRSPGAIPANEFEPPGAS
jgi:23S rRNA (cytosine1962-C5)-methyltransferase